MCHLFVLHFAWSIGGKSQNYFQIMEENKQTTIAMHLIYDCGRGNEKSSRNIRVFSNKKPS
jgi:hypothetical protein